MRSGLFVTNGDSVAIPHPLVRSAVSQAATVDDGDLHGARADVLDTWRMPTVPHGAGQQRAKSSTRSSAPC